MTLVIEDAGVVRDIERLADAWGKEPAEALADLVKEQMLLLPEKSTRKLDPEQWDGLILHIQEAYKKYHDPNDYRTADEIIGYNELGLFD